MPNVSEIYFFYVGNCEPYFYVECRVAYWLWRTVPFLLLGIGTVGNVLNIVILSRKYFRNFSTGIYLHFLAISDLIFLWTCLFPDAIYGITKYRFIDQSEIICRTRYWLIMTSAGFSVLVLVLLTIERTLVIKVPFFARTNLTARLARTASAIGIFMIGLINSHFIYGFTIRKPDYMKTAQHNESEQLMSSNVICYYTTDEYKHFYEGTWSIILFVVYNSLPAVIICIGNINIALLLLSRKKKWEKCINRTKQKQATCVPPNKLKQTIDETKIIKMMFTLNFVFLITTMPYCIYYVIRGQIEEISERNVARWQMVTVVVNILLWCNYTFNFFFYFINGNLFKKEWQKLLRQIRTKTQNVVTDKGKRSVSTVS